MEATGDGDEYGPTALSVLEYTARLLRRHACARASGLGALGGARTDYVQRWGGDTYRITCRGDRAEALINGRGVFSVPAGCRVETTQEGEVLRVDPIVPVLQL